MSDTPVICFGQQPCGIFPKRFLVAKILTAWRLQKEIGGRIVFFFHDSDHDYRETATLLTHKKTGQKFSFNFTFPNKTHKKYTPLYRKHFKEDWKAGTRRQLPNYVDKELVEIFDSVETTNISDFCLEVYEKMGWLDEVEVVRSSDSELRSNAIDIEEHFADLEWQGELVRAQRMNGKYCLHRGGNAYHELPDVCCEKSQISPTRDSRLLWMQSIIGCTHYIAGEGELAYLDQSQTPEIEFVKRDAIENSSEAWTTINS
ncbi:MAG: hypothetical protein MI748_20785 [Opitutales bacterium]|nr:hypothetical protein [Opitutales bacterium]